MSAANVEQRTASPRLVRAVGTGVILASAVSQEYGSGVNFVLPNSLGAYPGATWAVPFAMLAAGILLLPKVGMFARFAAVMPRAGSSYVWLSRSTNLPVGFIVAFLWFIGVVAAMGFLAFSFATFLSSTLDLLGLPGAWVLTPGGHLVVGIPLIILIFLLHYSGIRSYGAFVLVIFALVIVASAVTVAYGFSTDQPAFLSHAGSLVASMHPPAQQTPSVASITSVITLFLFAYGGLTAATSLGGEANNPTRTLPRGIWGGWLTALVLYTLIAFALFHAVPWWVVKPLVAANHAAVVTTPGLIALVAPRAVGVFMNIVVMIIVGKTVAPEMLDCSRYLFAWAQDGLVPRAFLHTGPARTPDLALGVSAALGILFLLDATFVGWSVGVTLRSMSLVLVFGVLGVGVWNIWLNRGLHSLDWVRKLREHRELPVAAAFAIAIAIWLESSVLVEPKLAWYFQPSFQALCAIVLGAALYLAARLRQGRSLESRALEAPIE